MNSLAENSHASEASKNVLKVPHAGRYHRVSQPVKALSITRLNERIRNVPHSRVTMPIAGDDLAQPGPAIARKATRTAASSPIHTSTCRGSRCKAGSYSAWQIRKVAR